MTGSRSEHAGRNLRAWDEITELFLACGERFLLSRCPKIGGRSAVRWIWMALAGTGLPIVTIEDLVMPKALRDRAQDRSDIAGVLGRGHRNPGPLVSRSLGARLGAS